MKTFTKLFFMIVTIVSATFGSESATTTDTIIFDVINVLSRYTEQDAKDSLKMRLGITDSDLDNVVKNYIKIRKEKDLKRFDEDLFWEVLSDVCSIDLPEDISQNFIEDISKGVQIDPEMHRDMISLKMKGYNVCLIANQDPFLYKALKMKGFFDQFDYSVISYAEKVSKPSSEIFETFLKKSGKKASECVLIDSSQKSLEVAKSLGFKTVCFNIHENKPEDLKRKLVEAILGN